MDPDTDNDGMPDGWEFASGTHPKFDDSEEDPDLDGYDVDGDGAVLYEELVSSAEVDQIMVELGDYVEADQTVAYAKTVRNGAYALDRLAAPVSGYVYSQTVKLLDGLMT